MKIKNKFMKFHTENGSIWQNSSSKWPKFHLIYRLIFSRIVFHGNICHRSNDEIVCDEPQILFPSGLEYIRFHYCGIVTGGIGIGRCAGIVGAAIISIGKLWRFSSSLTDDFF